MKKLLVISLACALLGNSLHAMQRQARRQAVREQAVRVDNFRVENLADLLDGQLGAHRPNAQRAQMPNEHHAPNTFTDYRKIFRDIVRHGDCDELIAWFKDEHRTLTRLIGRYTNGHGRAVRDTVERLRTVITDTDSTMRQIQNAMDEISEENYYTPEEGFTDATRRESLALIAGYYLQQRRAAQKGHVGRMSKKDVHTFLKEYYKGYIKDFRGTDLSTLEEQFRKVVATGEAYKLQRFFVRGHADRPVERRDVQRYLQNYADEKEVHRKALAAIRRYAVTAYTSPQQILDAIARICDWQYYAGSSLRSAKRRLPLVIAVGYYLNIQRVIEERRRPVQQPRARAAQAQARGRAQARRGRNTTPIAYGHHLDKKEIKRVIHTLMNRRVSNAATRAKAKTKEKLNFGSFINKSTVATLVIGSLVVWGFFKKFLSNKKDEAPANA